jgi:L-ascorbate metabolism protein UlaG (beta-lactamase superfamily)
MIEPIQKGTALLNDIHSTQPEPGQIAVWWLGQSGYVFKTASVTWWIDLYLSEYLTHKYAQTSKPHIRMTESPLRGHEITGATWIFASHRHSDHLDPGTLPDLMRASPESRLVLPLAAVDHAVGLGLPRERLIPTRGDETFSAGPLTVHSIPSAHPEFDFTEDNGYPFLGFVFEVDGLCIYHSGDTLAYDGLAERLRGYALDLAFLPINGAGIPGTPGNMSSAEAVALAMQIHLRRVVPCHYDLFSFNTADVSEFARLADEAGIAYQVLRPGEKWLWSRT